jgi:tRNA 2-thiouridine synthesizing protein E
MSDVIELDGTLYELDFKGHLQDFKSWSPRLMEWYAEQEKIELTDDHRMVIDSMRKYFENNRALPVARGVIAEMGAKIGWEKGTIQYFHKLFPTGIHQAHKIAGLPRVQLSV